MAEESTTPPFIDMTCLPDILQETIDFRDTSFFQVERGPPPQLPTPVEIIQRYGNPGCDVIKIEQLNLVVKIASLNQLAMGEAQTLRALNRAFPNNEILAPELFGWRKHNDCVFMYMSLISGKTLRELWPSLTEEDKETVCGDLRRIVSILRQTSHNSSANLIGSIGGGAVLDRYFLSDPERGPFQGIAAFNDQLFVAATHQTEEPKITTGPYRDILPDVGRIFLTHGDLTLGNIILSGGNGPQKVVGIVDWEQAGWYPDYWEYCKIRYGVEYSHEWRDRDWAETITEPFPDAALAHAEYSLWRGAP